MPEQIDFKTETPEARAERRKQELGEFQELAVASVVEVGPEDEGEDIILKAR